MISSAPRTTHVPAEDACRSEKKPNADETDRTKDRIDMKILKIGGSFITKKSGYREPDPANIGKAAAAVARVWKKGVRDFILVHGAGSFGHALVIKHDIANGIQSTAEKIGYSDTHAACSELSLLLVKALVENGVPAISIPPAVIIEQKNKRISRFDTRVVLDYLSSGYLPILYGDMVPDKSLGGSVCSGDQIVPPSDL